ncbi:phage tail domain-containing protein [Emticicia sp. 17c]|uniref:phage tail domain-containing protein n=1 Tax=Emticicia sp. 17c TaxID=3127704 RepID=UPI00301C5928
MPEETFTETTGVEAALLYKIDGVDFLHYGVYVSASKGIVDMPSLKEPQTVDWPGSHGTVVDLSAPRYNAREIELECFMRASGKLDFFQKARAFIEVFQKPRLRKLELVIANKPLIYMVYLPEGIAFEKQWHTQEMFGTFTLKLVEPSPVKMLLKTTTTEPEQEIELEFHTQNPIDIYWGDGSSTLNALGLNLTKSHTYAVAGTYYVLFCGVIENITGFSGPNTEIVWSKY